EAQDGIRDATVTGVQTCALPILRGRSLLWPLAVTLTALVAWEAVVAALRVKTLLLPRPSLVAGVLWSRAPLILEHMWPTFYQIEIGRASCRETVAVPGTARRVGE